jgi:hypothetical protein
MDTHNDREPLFGIGAFWVITPALWVVVAMAGFTLLSNRPDWFADPARTLARSTPVTPAPASVQDVNQDAALVPVSTVLGAGAEQRPRSVVVP